MVHSLTLCTSLSTASLTWSIAAVPWCLGRAGALLSSVVTDGFEVETLIFGLALDEPDEAHGAEPEAHPHALGNGLIPLALVLHIVHCPEDALEEVLEFG